MLSGNSAGHTVHARNSAARRGGGRARSIVIVAFAVGAILFAFLWNRETRTARRALEAQNIPITGAELLARAGARDASGARDIVSAKDTTVAVLLLQAGVSAGARDAWQRTPLHLAAWTANVELANLLLSRGADVNACDAQGRTPLHLAVAAANLPMAQLLIDQGADATRADKYGLTPLHRAAWNGNHPLITLLLEHGASATTSDVEGDTPLHLGSWANDKAVVDSLLGNGADPNVRGSDGSTPLHMALCNFDLESTSLLLGKGARPDTRDESNSTPLHRAVWSGSVEAVRLLLDAGADVNARDAEGRTPLHRLWKADATDIADLLLDRGADVNARTHEGFTPLDCVRANNCEKLAKRLLARGGEPGAASPSAPATSASPSHDNVSPAGDPSWRAQALERYRQRLRGLLAQGILPIVDVEFHYGALESIEDILEKMQANQVALIWMGANPRLGSEITQRLCEAFPDSIVPLTCHGQERPWISSDATFLESLRAQLATGRCFGMGEFECRHYATLCNDRDVYTRVDSPQMASVFAMSEKYGVPFLLHHEGEDALLPELERMLDRYPRAKVIWCHGGRSRNAVTWKKMSQPHFVLSLLRRHPNLYFDVVQMPSKPRLEESAPLYDISTTGEPALNPDWREVILQCPDRFLVGSDANSRRLQGYRRMMETTRNAVLAYLPDDVAAQVAFKNAWRLMSGGDWRN